jgi:hypothetical protein
MLNNQEIRATLDRHWEATVAFDLMKVHEIYHDDVVVDFHSLVNESLGTQLIRTQGTLPR